MAVGSALILALVGGPFAVFHITGSVDSYPNASQNAFIWNATLNGSATFFDIGPVFIAIILLAVVMLFYCTRRGF